MNLFSPNNSHIQPFSNIVPKRNSSVIKRVISLNKDNFTPFIIENPIPNETTERYQLKENKIPDF